MAHLRLDIPGLSIGGIAETGNRALPDIASSGGLRPLRRVCAAQPSAAAWLADARHADLRTDEEKVLERVRA